MLFSSVLARARAGAFRTAPAAFVCRTFDSFTTMTASTASARAPMSIPVNTPPPYLGQHASISTTAAVEMAIRKGRRRAPGPPPIRGPSNQRNHGIKVEELLVINSDGVSLGQMKTNEAIEVAKGQGLDLVLVSSPEDETPVARVMSFANFAAKHTETATKNRKDDMKKVKEVRFSSRIADGDLMVKSRKLVGFLEKGHSVKVTVSIQGRDIWRRQDAQRREVMAHVVRMVGDAGRFDPDIKVSGNTLSTTVSPPAEGKPVEHPDPIFAALEVSYDQMGKKESPHIAAPPPEPVPSAASASDPESTDADGEPTDGTEPESGAEGDGSELETHDKPKPQQWRRSPNAAGWKRKTVLKRVQSVAATNAKTGTTKQARPKPLPGAPRVGGRR